MRILVSFSGGKDSQAALIHTVEKYGSDKVEAVFCDTGWGKSRGCKLEHWAARIFKVGIIYWK